MKYATEHWLSTMPLRLRSFFRWAQADQELDDELREPPSTENPEYVAHVDDVKKRSHRRAHSPNLGVSESDTGRMPGTRAL